MARGRPPGTKNKPGHSAGRPSGSKNKPGHSAGRSHSKHDMMCLADPLGHDTGHNASQGSSTAHSVSQNDSFTLETQSSSQIDSEAFHASGDQTTSVPQLYTIYDQQDDESMLVDSSIETDNHAQRSGMSSLYRIFMFSFSLAYCLL